MILINIIIAAENNGVTTSNVTELIEYLKTIDLKVFYATNTTLIEKPSNIKYMERMFAPVVEGKCTKMQLNLFKMFPLICINIVPGSLEPFLSKTPRDILSDDYISDVDIMFGVATSVRFAYNICVIRRSTKFLLAGG